MKKVSACESKTKKFAEEVSKISEEKIRKLRNSQPRLIDCSLRESIVGSQLGHTLEDKINIFESIRKIGFKDVILGTLNYSEPGGNQVEDDFMVALRDQCADTSGCYALIDPGHIGANKVLIPSPSMLKWSSYQVPNAILEICLHRPCTPHDDWLPTLIEDLNASINWCVEQCQRQQRSLPRIAINIIDGCNVFATNVELACDFLKLLSPLKVDALSLEDGLGTSFHFQLSTYIEIARKLLPETTEIWVHIHAAYGLENAAALDALIAGADGVWAALTRRGALVGHASLLELIANLLRAGNQSLSYLELSNLGAAAQKVHALQGRSAPPEDTPLIGSNAMRLPNDFFRQDRLTPMGLDPRVLGLEYRYRVCPVVSNVEAIAARLSEVTGWPAGSVETPTLTQMISIMRQRLRRGEKRHYDEPKELLSLFFEARQILTLKPTSKKI